jgi:hypothetical protein
MHHLLEDAGTDPPLDLLVAGSPSRRVVGNHAPKRPGPHEPAQCVVDRLEVMLVLRLVLAV